ncbi:Os05g0343066 [Oryza sativa Japonica Group]|uniref:Os05g0343066 protein n=1 Tax=Oryza sativa subsp. japonica TaxID=39947 RepID=A0A0P0WKZ3_ORYSJ|nr:Os05g0343066 [Oryza sativa Japonica Group]
MVVTTAAPDIFFFHFFLSATSTERPLSVGVPAGEGSGNGKNDSHAWPAQRLTAEMEVVGEGLWREACEQGVGAPVSLATSGGTELGREKWSPGTSPKRWLHQRESTQRHSIQ